MNDSEMMASGYTAGSMWCLRCDVGWTGLENETCWLCGKDDKTWRWGWAALKRALGLEDADAVPDTPAGGAHPGTGRRWGEPTRRDIPLRPRAGDGTSGSPPVGPRRSHEGERG